VGYGKISASDLQGKMVAVDSPGTMHRMRAVCKKDYLRHVNPFTVAIDDDAIDAVWLMRSLKQVIEYLNLGFLPVLVFDGKKSPLKMTKAGAERLSLNKKAVDELQALREIHSGIDPLLIPAADVAKARTLLESIDRMPRASVEKYKLLMQELGLPWVQSNGEGERTCSLLNAQGLCHAVLSVDGDCFPFGANLILRERIDVYDDDGFGSVGFSTAEIEPLLDSVGMDFKLFQQLCIMSGTDFNHNVKGIGFNKAIPLLRKHRGIRGLSKVMDVSILNYGEVKEEFEIVSWKDTAVEWCLEMKNDSVSDDVVLKKYGMELVSEQLANAKSRIAGA
jgi:flap endonuclease-1